jgi:hypothetical protein
MNTRTTFAGDQHPEAGDAMKPASRTIRRRTAVAAFGLALAPALARAAGAAGAAPRTPIEVWKDPQCGCCKDWVAHLEANGFAVKVNETGNDAARTRLGVDPKYGSCHTGSVAGYAIEGHVPARDIRRLLADKPVAVGLAVPGMPVGSPGMDGPAYGGRKDPFDVLLLGKGGSAKVYQRYAGTKA